MSMVASQAAGNVGPTMVDGPKIDPLSQQLGAIQESVQMIKDDREESRKQRQDFAEKLTKIGSDVENIGESVKRSHEKIERIEEKHSELHSTVHKSRAWGLGFASALGILGGVGGGTAARALKQFFGG